MSCGTMGQSHPIVRTTDQSKAWQLEGETRFFSTHELIACAAGVAHLGNLAALKPPLFEVKWDLDILYMRPLSFVPCNDVSPWYHCKQCIGRNMIATMVRRFSQQTGLESGKTNHSLRATGASSLWEGLGSLRLNSNGLAFPVTSMTCCLGNLCATF